jgi:hypothetical protein
MGAGNMPFLVGQCCVDQIIQGDSGSSDSSGKNEIIPFSNVSTLTIPWNATRKARFGDAGVLYVEILGEDGKYRNSGIEAVPNVVPNTASYNIDLGGLATGRVIIT